VRSNTRSNPFFQLQPLSSGFLWNNVGKTSREYSSASFKGARRVGVCSKRAQRGKWVFSELKNEPVLSHFYCITSCLLAHCLFGRFFLASFPLYSGGSDATLAHPR